MMGLTLITHKQLETFYRYVWSFYGTEEYKIKIQKEYFFLSPRPIYPIKGLTQEMIIKATKIYLEDSKRRWCDGDSIDRENVRDIILKTYNLEWS